MTRPLVVRFGALGDMVLMTVAIRHLSARFGMPVDIIGSGEWTDPLLRGQPGVGDIYLLRGRNRPFWAAPDQWRLIRSLRRRGAGPTWLFDARTHEVQRLLSRAGWAAADQLALDRLVDIPGEHFCDHWRRFAELSPSSVDIPAAADGLTARPAKAFPELMIPSALRPQLVSWISQLGVLAGRYILIQVGNKRTMRRGSRQRSSNTKYWPEQRWADLLRGLRDLHPDFALLMLGVIQEAAMNDEILALAGVGNARNLARDMSVPRLMALSEAAFGMISVDTGPAHVAAAIGCPVLTLFDSPTKLAMYAPRGPEHFARCLVGGTDAAPSMLGIAPEVVLSAWQDIGAQSPDSPASQSRYNAYFDPVES